MPDSSKKALPYILLVGTIYGSNMVVARFCLGQYAPLSLVALRLVIAALVYFIVYTFVQARHFPRDTKLWAKAGFSGILSTAIPLSGFVAAMQYISSGMTGLLDTIVPVFVVLMAHLFLDERITRMKLMGTFIAFAGTGLLYLRGESGLANLVRADWRGYALAGLAILSSASGIIYGRRYLRQYDVIDISAMRMICAAIILLPSAALTSGFDFSKVNGNGVLALIHLAIIGTFLAFMLDFYILKQFGAGPAAQSIYVIPAAAISLGAIFLHERVTLIMICGMALIVSGLIMVNRQRT